MDRRFYKPVQIANTAVPAVGFFLSIPALAALVVHAAKGNSWQMVSFSIYGSTLVIS